MEKFIPCSLCNNGYIYNGDSVQKCSCLKAYQKSVQISLGFFNAGVTDDILPDLKNYKGKDVRDNLSKIRKYVNGLSDKYMRNSHLYLVGPNGSQKTYTAKAIIKEAIEKDLSCKFVLMNDLIKKLTSIYEEGYSNSIEEYYNCDILVLDDCFDVKKVTLFKSGYQIPYLDEFLRKRIEQLGGNIIFTSNIQIEDINEDKFSKDIKNLLTRSIKDKGGELYFSDIYSSIEDKEILSMWN
jgi:DNA replication protein DnaC